MLLKDKLHTSLLIEHLEEASFLYAQRCESVLEDDVSWVELDGFCDQRLEAHLDALVIGGELALELCKRQAIEGDAGELFAAVGVFGAGCLPLFG